MQLTGMYLRLPAVLCCFFFTSLIYAQTENRSTAEKCGTMQRLYDKFKADPQLKQRFEAERSVFSRSVSEDLSAGKASEVSATVYIPVVFHVVLSNPSLVTDAQIQAQLDTLNLDFFGSNGDSVKIPDHFKSLFGKSGIQFCLARRTPDGEETTGIVRVASQAASFGVNDEVKHSASGGSDSWNTEKYFNVWICTLNNGILGYASFPDDGAPSEQGVAIDYRSLPGGSFSGFDEGKTLTHETGHYFNLYHIWGDDGGSCTGTDFVDDTPNQAASSSGCNSGIKTDNCSPTGNGIMYQNYMDYSHDDCLLMFTKQQVVRMETALSLYRSGLLSSPGCQPVVLRNYDVQLRAITQPVQRLCGPSFTPVVTIRNRGSETLTSLLIQTSIDNGTVSSYTWNGTLSSLATATISLKPLTTTPGTHTLTVFVTQPNNTADEETSNDTLRMLLQYLDPVPSVKESFESITFPPYGWDVVNPDGATTWQRTTAAAKTGTASVIMNNYNYSQLRQRDDLRLPLLSIPASADSAFFSFQLAAATYSDLTAANNIWDTLEVLVSTDCGQTYTSLYKKWGATLVTTNFPITTSYVPASTEWRKDSVNLGAYIGSSSLLIAFRNTNGYENNIYLDDIQLRTVSINPVLKEQGFLVTPNPARDVITVQFYPQPVQLRALQLYATSGQLLQEIRTSSGQAANYYRFDLAPYAAGSYYVRAVFTDRVLMKKIIRL